MSDPQWEHYCSGCTYLGSSEDKKLYDLYHCTYGPGHTVIARYGSEDIEYLSGLAAAEFVPVLGIAKRLAMDMGLIHETTKRSGAIQ